MKDCRQFYIDGKWVAPTPPNDFPVTNPANEDHVAVISLGTAADVDKAVKAARKAFETFGETTPAERLEILNRIIAAYQAHYDELVESVSTEMGAPLWLSRAAQVAAGMGHFFEMTKVLSSFQFEETKGTTLMRKEPIGVCGLITPWNWPLNQIACKVAPALAAGCTMVLKPSEVSPLSAIVFTEILDEAGVPAGVFNLVQGDGATVGAALAAHPDVDMVSFTGSTRAGIEVARLAAPTVKRVAQELGGKSANIVLDDADLAAVVARDVASMCTNSGQSCNAPSRMLVPAGRMEEAAAIAAEAAANVVVGDPNAESTRVGPVVSEVQFDRIQVLLARGVEEGAKLEIGGPGRPDGLDKGYFVKPTVFANVTNDMTIAREAMARRIRSGNVHLNGGPGDLNAPFGGYKQSGNGREWGELGMEEFLERQAILGCNA